MIVCLLVYLSFGHCVVCPSVIYGFLLPLWFLKAFLIWFMWNDKYLNHITGM